MKILQLCKKFPFPLKDGESIAVTTLSKALNELGCEVTLLAMNTRKHFFDLKKLPVDFDHYHQIHTIEVDNRIKAVDAFLNLFSPHSYHIARFVTPGFRDKLIRLLKENDFDLVQLETLYLAPYIPQIREYSNAIISMRAHNVEHEIWRRITDNTSFALKKWYLDLLTKKLKRFEQKQLNNYDLLVAITERDLRMFKSLGYGHTSVVSPIGIDTGEYLPDYRSFGRDLSVSFIGSLDWIPNQEGLKWFLDKVWSQVHLEFPCLKLHIAGRNTPSWVLNLNMKNVEVHGEVPNATNFINNHSLMVVPLLSGSGMRAKILEGMALGKVILTTTLGLEGIAANHREEVLLADKPEEFIDGIRYCYRLNSQLENIGRRAQEFVERYYDSRKIAKQLLDTYISTTVGASEI